MSELSLSTRLLAGDHPLPPPAISPGIGLSPAQCTIACLPKTKTAQPGNNGGAVSRSGCCFLYALTSVLTETGCHVSRLSR